MHGFNSEVSIEVYDALVSFAASLLSNTDRVQAGWLAGRLRPRYWLQIRVVGAGRAHRARRGRAVNSSFEL